MLLPEKPSDGDKGLHRAAIDFDNILALDTWPSRKLGDPIPTGLRFIEFYYDLGYEVVIYTSRPASHEPLIRAWLEKLGYSDMVYEICTGKPRAVVYVDDRAWNPTEDKEWSLS